MKLENLAAVQTPETDVIGYLTWYSIGEHTVSREALRQKLINAGLEEKYLPNEIRPSDAFRRATKEVESSKKIENGQRNFLVREVYADKTMIQRNIVVEEVDQQGKRLWYDPAAATMFLEKEINHFSFSATSQETEVLAKEAERLFNIYRTTYPAQAVRVMVANIIKSMAATPVRPTGGVYFIPASHTDTLFKLVSFLNSLDKGEGFKVPLINTAENRGMVSKKLREHIENLLYQCRTGIEGEVRKGELKAIIEDARRVIGDYKEYKSLVTGDVAMLDGYVDSLKNHVAELLNRL
ncbi:DUF6744 family protein [Thermicanus aegyptius]|uniref:DUF6744 family protein n=1 Tax=Thermicanus aegyptius TaxID=94009 RepID=UPI0003F7CD23|nr:DUF6744 family protein [Thermicanus aegyptius]